MLAQITDNGIGLGGLFNGIKIDPKSYSEVIKSFKEIGSFDDFIKDGEINWNLISESIEGCDEIVLSYFKTLEDGNGVINKQSASVEGLGAYLKQTGQMFDFAKIKAMALNTVLNMTASWFITTGITLLVKGIDNLIHAEERAIEAGEEAQGKIKSLSKDYREHAATTRKLGTRYDELSSGVDKYGNNIGLTDEDYKEFLDISNQLVEIYPELLDHYDSAGNAILNLGNNSESAAKQLEALLEQERRMANYDIEQQLPDVFAGVEASVKQHERNIEQYEKQVQRYNDSAERAFDLTTTINGDGFHFSINAADEMANEYFNAIEAALNDAGIGEDRYSLTRGNIAIDENGENIAEDYLNVWGLSNDEIASVQKALESQFEKLSGSASRASSDFQKDIITEQNLIKQQYSNLGTYISSWLTTTDDFIMLSDDMQIAIQSALNNLDYSKINFDSLEGLKKYIIDNFITVFSKKDPQIQAAIEELFSLDKNDMSVEEYRNKVNSLVEQIVGSGDDYEQARIDFRVAFGFTAVNEDGYEILTEDTMLQNIANKTGIPFDDLSKELNVGDIQLAYNIIANGEFKGASIEELKRAIQSKATEASFDIETLTNSYNDLTSEISATTSALSEQSAGQSIALDTYDELIKTNADYADALEYSNGVMQLNADKVKEIVKAKTEETIANNEAAKAQKQAEYHENAKQIEYLSGRLKRNTALSDEWKDGIREQISALRDRNDAIVADCDKIDYMNRLLRESTGEYQAWKDAQNAPESGDMFDDTLKAMDDIWNVWDKKSENYMKFGTDKYKTAVEFLIPDTVDSKDAEAVKNYMKSIKKYLTWDDDGNQDGLNLGKFIQDSCDKGLMYLDKTSNQYMIAGEKTMQEFADGLGLSLPMVQAIFGELEEYGAEFNWGDDVYENIGDAVTGVDEQIQSLQDSLDYLEEQKAAGIKIDDSYIIEIKKQLEEAIGLRDELCKEASAKVNTYIDTEEKLNSAQSKYEFWKAKLEKDPTNIFVQGQVEYFEQQVSQIQEEKDQLGEPTTIEINLAKEQIANEIAETENTLNQLKNTEYLTKIGVSEEGASYTIAMLEEKLERLKTEQGNIIQIFGDTSDVDSKLDTIEQEEIPDKEFDVIANVAVAKSRITQIKNSLDEIKDKEITLTTNKVITVTKKYEGKGPFNGTAHQSGTAHAGGNWGTTTSETALVGELGREIIVNSRTGRWYTVGDNGAEFVNIPKGSIVFNHLQTQELLSKGYVSSRAQALASGTAFASGTAYAPGSQYVSGGGLDVSIVSKHSSANKTKTTTSQAVKNSAAVAENTRKAAEAAEEFNDQIDWIETRLERINTLLGWAKDSVDDIGRNRNMTGQIAELDNAIQYAKGYLNVAYEAGSIYQTYADSIGLAYEYVEKIKNGTMVIETITNETLKDQIERYQTWYEKAIKCYDTVHDLNKEIKNLQLQKLEAVTTWADYNISYQEALANRMQAYIDLANTKGIDNTEMQFNYMIDRQATIKGKLETELSNLRTQFNSLMQQGVIEKYSQEWHEWVSKIYDVETAMIEADTEMEKLRNDINDLRWEKFNRGITFIENISDEISDLIDLYDDSMFFDDNGKTTKDGTAVLGLYEQQVEIATIKSKQYADALVALRKDLMNGNISQNEYNDKVAEYSKLQREASASIKQYRDAIVNLIETGINKETDAYTKLNTAKKESLQAQKDLDDYNKQVSEKSNAVSKLEAEYASLIGVGGREAQAKREQLLQQIEDAKMELKELQDDRAYNDQLDYLDEDSKKFSEMQDERIELLNSSLEYQNAAIAAMLSNTVENSKDTLSSINDIAKNYGMELGEYLTLPWETGRSAMDEYLYALYAMGVGVNNVDTSKMRNPSYGEAIKTSSFSKAIGSINSLEWDDWWREWNLIMATDQSEANRVKDIEAHMKKLMNSLGGKYASGTRRATKGTHLTQEDGLEAIMTKYGLLTPFVGGEAVFNADATDNLYSFANNPASFLQDQIKSIKLPDIPITQGILGGVNLTYDSLITVNGDVIEDTIPKLQDIVKSAIPAVKQDLSKELKLLGRNINYYR